MDASSSALIEGLRAAAKVKDLSGQFDPSPRYLVGSGGYSTVCIATWRPPECEGPMKVCYKELRPPVSNMREAVERTRKTVKYLTREMGVWSELDHPNILKFLGFAVEGDGCDVKGVLVSPWCPNGSVLEYLEKNPHAERIGLARGIAKGLDYLHHLMPAVIHGDLKPANVLVGDDHKAILCDFGLSRFSSELTTGQTSSAVAFTIRFTPPEVICNEERKSTESDVYSFACTCIPILFGKQPFSGLNDIQVVARIPKEGPWNWDLKDPLQRTLSDCCSVVTKNRPSIREVLQTAAFVGSFLPPRGTTGAPKSVIAPHDARTLGTSNPRRHSSSQGLKCPGNLLSASA
ncbi:kinase-like domain-containing protein [Cantharellus anzutake]|uniref:kinase-like domain-containing protein n=1 Tax=Cantharellus anzutake TaxID=1750568 RepID=UPI0019048153|nr:kinase-like domain-containing protein [Cantharellus anzutake]KAF8331386.1 kinase-like domain-containing protein [Cantharellus anzutake]